jgi:4-hydroxybenzoate polyprenyltransferase
MIKSFIKLFRIPQWIKNFFIFVPLVFSKNLFEGEYLAIAVAGFFLFSVTSSVVYVINDIIDIEADKSHPQKKFRPLASGKISRKSAFISVLILVIIVAVFTPLFNILFALTLIFYFLLNVLYSFWLKHVVILDVFCIAGGFMLRIIAGAVIIDVQISSWLILTTMFISLFLGIMKRHSELTVLEGNENVTTRKVLGQYSLNFSDQIATIAAAGVIICYALYTVSERTVGVFGTDKLIYTTPFVVFGIFRYMFLVYINKQGENTTQIMLTDKPMIITVILYFITIVLIVYRHSFY